MHIDIDTTDSITIDLNIPFDELEWEDDRFSEVEDVEYDSAGYVEGKRRVTAEFDESLVTQAIMEHLTVTVDSVYAEAETLSVSVVLEVSG